MGNVGTRFWHGRGLHELKETTLLIVPNIKRGLSHSILHKQYFNITTIRTVCEYDMWGVCCISALLYVGVDCMFWFVIELLLVLVLISGPLIVPRALNHGSYLCLVTDSDNVKILLDGDKILQMGGDLEELAVVSDVADVSQDDFLLIHFPHFKVLKQII